jgi:hypothetical protein
LSTVRPVSGVDRCYQSYFAATTSAVFSGANLHETNLGFTTEHDNQVEVSLRSLEVSEIIYYKVNLAPERFGFLLHPFLFRICR